MTRMRWLDALAPELEYRGLVGERRALLHRVPTEWRDRLPADTWMRLCAASGVRVAFRTDSPTIAVRAEWLSQQTNRANAEIDLYQNGEFYGQLRCLGLGTAEGVIYDGPARDRCVELYMPPYAEIRLAGVGRGRGCIRAYSRRRPWMVHGCCSTATPSPTAARPRGRARPIRRGSPAAWGWTL